MKILLTPILLATIAVPAITASEPTIVTVRVRSLLPTGEVAADISPLPSLLFVPKGDVKSGDVLQCITSGARLSCAGDIILEPTGMIMDRPSEVSSSELHVALITPNL